MRDITNKTDGAGDVLTAGDFNAFNDELENLVRSSGETLDLPGGPDNNLFMIAQTIATYAASTYEDTGAADVYVLARHDLLKDPKGYFDGMQVSFKAIATNTGASTVNVASLGVKSIVRQDESILTASNITINLFSTIIYNSTLGKFILQDRSTIVELLLNKQLTAPKINEAVDLLATSTELNTMDGILSTTTEMNLLVGALSLIKGINDTATLTNKTISGDNNTVTEVDSVKDQGVAVPAGLKMKVYEIGSWNMDTVTDITFAHGLDYKKVISMDWTIIGDYSFDRAYSQSRFFSGAMGVTGFLTATLIGLSRSVGGPYDSTSFDDTAINRGWVLLWYKD